MKNIFTLRFTSCNLRGNYILKLPIPKTTTYGLRSFSYDAANQRNSLPGFFSNCHFIDFKKASLDPNLTYEDHITKTVSTCMSRLVQINRVKHVLD